MGVPDQLNCILRNLHVSQEAIELDMEQQTSSKLGEDHDKTIYCHFTYLSYMQDTSCEMPDWMNHKLESRLSGEMPTTSDMQKISL